MATVANETFGREELHAALRGEESSVRIYWDDGDPQNEGPACEDARGERDPLDFVCWASVNDNVKRPNIEGYQIVHFFDEHGDYRGPDNDGIYPVMR
jgi:hypothetical protein